MKKCDLDTIILFKHGNLHYVFVILDRTFFIDRWYNGEFRRELYNSG